jgi:CBS domain-containing protein
MPIVRDIMTARPTSIRVTAPARAAIATMMELDVRHLPVVNEDHELVGMLSDRDFARVRGEEPIANVMSSDVIAVDAEDDMLDVVDLILEHRIGAVPVVQRNGHLIGIVSYIDILRRIRQE